MNTKILTRADHDPGPEWPEIRRQMEITAGANERHMSRTRATFEAALIAARFPGDESAARDRAANVARAMEDEPSWNARERLKVELRDPEMRDTVRRAYMLIEMDRGGIGGPKGYTGLATDRMIWAQGLGKGRWHASDGEAYMAASDAALSMLRCLVVDDDTHCATLSWSLDQDERTQQQCAAVVSLFDHYDAPDDVVFTFAHCLRKIEAAYTPAEAHAWELTLYQCIALTIIAGDTSSMIVHAEVDSLSQRYPFLDRWIDRDRAIAHVQEVLNDDREYVREVLND